MEKTILGKLKMNSLSRQLLVGFTLILLSVLLLAGVYQYFFMKDVFYGKAEELLQSRLHNVSIGELVDIREEADLREKGPDLIDRMIDTKVSVTILDQKGEVVADSEEGSRAHYGRSLMQEEDLVGNLGIDYPRLSRQEYVSLAEYAGVLEGVRIEANSSGERYMLQIVKVGNPGNGAGLIQLSTSMEETEALLAKNARAFLLLAFAAFLMGMVLIRNLLSLTLKPLRSFTNTIEAVSGDQLNLRLPQEGTQVEMGRLVSAFNKMLDRLEASFVKELEIKEKMKSFLSDASHELKTPITSIQGFAEVLAGGAAKDEAELKTSLVTIQKESERLTRLLSSLLSLSRLDRNEPAEKSPLRLDELLEEIYPQLLLMAGERELSLSISEEGLVLANPDQIRQIVLNLVQNAVQHTEVVSGKITIGLAAAPGGDKGRTQLVVQDNGTGITEGDLCNVFDRFYRSESHRSRESGGEGLGLSIVQEIVRQHGGEIQAFSTLGEGTRFVVWLPNFSAVSQSILNLD